MSNLFDRIYRAKLDYISRMCRHPTHIVMSYDLVNEVYHNMRGELKDISYDPINKIIHIRGLKVIPTEANLLDGDSDKFILLSDEASKNFPQHPPLKWE